MLPYDQIILFTAEFECLDFRLSINHHLCEKDKWSIIAEWKFMMCQNGLADSDSGMILGNSLFFYLSATISETTEAYL